MKLRTVIILIIIIALCGMAYYGIKNNDKGIEILTKTNIEDINTSLLQVQAKVKVINEQSVVKNDESLLKGAKLQDIQNEDIVSTVNGLKEKEIIREDEENYDKYYAWNQELLNELGLENFDNNILIVNYSTLEIILPNGIQLGENGEIFYKFSEIKNNFT